MIDDSKTRRPKKRSTHTDIQVIRQELQETLPGLIEVATHSYQTFVATPPPDDARGFTAYQAACRSALTHLQLLIKLSGWAETGITDGENLTGDDELRGLISDARAALAVDPT